jgi:hypothetical protein
MPLSGVRKSCGRCGQIDHTGQCHRQPCPALACVVGDQHRPSAQPGAQSARLIGQRDKRVGPPLSIVPTYTRRGSGGSTATQRA